MRRRQDTTQNGSPSHTTAAALGFLSRLIVNDEQIVDTNNYGRVYDLSLFVLALSVYCSLLRQDFYCSSIAYQRSYHDELIICHKNPNHSYLFHVVLSLSFCCCCCAFCFECFQLISYFLRLALL